MATANQAKMKLISQSADGNITRKQYKNCSIRNSCHSAMRQQQEQVATAARTSGNSRKTILKMTICQHAEVVVALLLQHMGFSNQTRKQKCHYPFLIGLALVTQYFLVERRQAQHQQP